MEVLATAASSVVVARCAEGMEEVATLEPPCTGRVLAAEVVEELAPPEPPFR